MKVKIEKIYYFGAMSRPSQQQLGFLFVMTMLGSFAVQRQACSGTLFNNLVHQYLKLLFHVGQHCGVVCVSEIVYVPATNTDPY